MAAKTGTSMVMHASYRAQKRMRKKRAQEESNWKKKNGPVIVRKATKEELSKLDI